MLVLEFEYSAILSPIFTDFVTCGDFEPKIFIFGKVSFEGCSSITTRSFFDEASEIVDESVPEIHN